MILDWKPSLVSFNEDYDIEEAKEQWADQHPLAVQVIAQYEFKTTSPIEVGTTVMINVEEGLWDGRWVSGRVTNVKEDGTYDVEYGFYVPDNEKGGDEVRWVRGVVKSDRLYTAGSYPKSPRNSTKERRLLRPLDDDAINGPLEFADYILMRIPEDEEENYKTWRQGYVIDGHRPDGMIKVRCHEGEGLLHTIRRDMIIKRFEPPVLKYPGITKEQIGGVIP